MTTRTLFRLGALATLVTALGIAVGEFLYLFGDVQTIFFAWFFIVVTVFQVFAAIALYTAQAQRGNMFTFLGFVLLIIGLIFYLMNFTGDIGVVTGLLTQAQLDRAGQIMSFVVLGTIANWSLNVGLMVFGYGTLRARVFPHQAGALLLVAGVIIFFRDITGVEYLFAVLSVVAWGWFGLALWKHASSIAS